MLKRMFVSFGGAVVLALLVAVTACPAQDRGTADRGAGGGRGVGGATTDRGLVFSGKILRVDASRREVVLGDVVGPTTGTGGGVGPRNRTPGGTGPAERGTGDRGSRGGRDLDKGDTATGGRAGGAAGPVDRTDTGRLGSGPNTMSYTLHVTTSAAITMDGHKAGLRDLKPGMFARAHVLAPDRANTTPGARSATPRETPRERDIREARGTPGAPGTGTRGAGDTTTSANARAFRWSADRIDAFAKNLNPNTTSTPPRNAERK
jgi:hypothetical protein